MTFSNISEGSDGGLLYPVSPMNCSAAPDRDALCNTTTNLVTPDQSPTRLQPRAQSPAENKCCSHLLAMETEFLPPCLLSERERCVFRVKIETSLGVFTLFILPSPWGCCRAVVVVLHSGHHRLQQNQVSMPQQGLKVFMFFH